MLSKVKERAKHWKTTGAGALAAGIIYYLFNSLGCEVPSNWTLWAIVAIPAIMGILSK